MKLDWLQFVEKSWHQRSQQNRAPHALLLAGPAGTGKRAAAQWIASQTLGLAGPDEPISWPTEYPQHADLNVLAPEEDKKSIGIDQVRALVAELNLTSYAGQGKVAIIVPADRLTVNAANSLLKTLEEPPGRTLIILVADRTSHLPTTVVSRCQKIKFNCPPTADALQWLSQVRKSEDWPRALATAGGAPLRAVDALEGLEETDAMARELNAVANRQMSPLVAAKRWAKLSPEFVLDWLCGQVQEAVRNSWNPEHSAFRGTKSHSAGARMDTRDLFCYLDRVNRLRAQSAGSFNAQLAFEDLLADWAQGLVGYEQRQGMEYAKLLLPSG